MEATKSALSNFVIVYFPIIIIITVIIGRIKDVAIKILREKQGKIYEEQRKKELSLYEESTKKKQGGNI